MTVSRLTFALTIDAVSSAATGVLLLAAGDPVAELVSHADTVFGVAMPTVLRGVGAAFLVFAALVVLAARTKAPTLVREVIWLNLGYVVGSVVLVAWAWTGLTLLGRLAILAVALAVAVFALLQGAGLRRATT